MSGGTFRTHSGLRAVINAWLEDISFRTGMIAGVVVLLVVAAAGAAVAVLGHSGQAASALGSRRTASPATAAAPSAAPSSAAPSSAAPARSARATPSPATPAPARSAAASAPGTGSPPAAGSGTAAVAAASGASRESYGLASPAGWRHGFPGWGERGWVWGPYRGGQEHFAGPWW